MKEKKYASQHADEAFEKVRQALKDLHAATGLMANALVHWDEDGEILGTTLFVAKSIVSKADCEGGQSIHIIVDTDQP